MSGKLTTYLYTVHICDLIKSTLQLSLEWAQEFFFVLVFRMMHCSFNFPLDTYILFLNLSFLLFGHTSMVCMEMKIRSCPIRVAIFSWLSYHLISVIIEKVWSSLSNHWRNDNGCNIPPRIIPSINLTWYFIYYM